MGGLAVLLGLRRRRARVDARATKDKERGYRAA
jgi:hypothetical protein